MGVMMVTDNMLPRASSGEGLSGSSAFSDRLAALSSLVDSSLNEVTFLTEQLKDAESKLESYRTAVDRYEADLNRNSRAHVIILNLIDRLNQQGLGSLDSLLTNALSQVWPDRRYSVVHEITEERGYNNLNFYLREVLVDSEGREYIQTSNIRNATGGSIRAILGLVCTAFYLMKTGSLRFIAMDEALSQVSDDVIDNLFSLLKSLGDDADFSFLMVTHDSRFLPYLNSLYRIQPGGTFKAMLP